MPDCMAERGRFEPPGPRTLLLAEFNASLAHYLAGIKASLLERIYSPGIRHCFCSLRLPSFARLYEELLRCRTSGEGFWFKSSLPGGQSPTQLFLFGIARGRVRAGVGMGAV
jgi:hypothetical protein